MDKLTSIRIKYSDGTYLDEVPIGVLAQNVGYDSGHNLIQVLGSVDVESNGTIQQQINKLFNEKLNTSDLSSYVNSKITTDVSKWLANNVNPVGSAVIVDQSLSISGAAADAQKTGKIFSLFTNLNSMISMVSSANNTPIEVSVDENSIVHIILPNRIYITNITTRGVFSYLTIDSPGEYILNNNQYLVAEQLNSTLDVKTFSEIRQLDKTNKYIILCANYSGNVVGTLSQYLISKTMQQVNTLESNTIPRLKSLESNVTQLSNFDSTLTNYTALNSIVYSASNVPIEVKPDENDNIIVTIPNRIYVVHITKLGVFAYDTIDQPGDYTIPDGSYLIAESETKTLSIKTFNEIRALDKIKKYTILCKNNKGMPFGTLSQYLLMEEIPYYTNYMTQVANKINTNKGAFGLNGLSFIFITDEHWKQNAKKSVYLIKELRKKTGIDMLINCGDILTKEKTKELAYSKISEYITELEDTNCKVYSCIGNHEFNNPNMSQAAADLAITLTLAEVCSVMYNRSNYSNAVFDLVSGCYYYDIDKTRIFVLQCNYGSNVYLTATRWILERMVELPEGYKIILFSHVIIEWSQSIETSVPKDRVNAVLNAMDAIKAGTSITYENRTYDYSKLSNVTPIAVFGGHAHIDYSFNTPGGIPVILTTCDSDIQEGGGLTRTRGTTTEQAFDVVSINYDTRTIKLVRVGAGSDRTFTY